MSQQNVPFASQYPTPQPTKSAKTGQNL